ncbi:MAG: toll/interleukin-1 receptor domain-containing protein [Woeseiaceae bacterium]|nr:toll/interleukin-1 receptor domain-containing protein [Woeseiaceae bacterium]
MTDVFISYKREDREKARALAETLARIGYDVWWDIELLPGQQFADEVNSVLNTAKAAIVLWTPEAVASNWVKAEASIALNRNILVPARLANVDLPAPYNTIHTSDLTSWDGSTDAPILKGLLAGIAKLAGEPVVPEARLSGADIEEVLAQPAYEVEFWTAVSTKKPQSIAEYEDYLGKFGENASFASLAKIRIDELRSKKPERQTISFAKVLALVGVAVGIVTGTIEIVDRLQPDPESPSTPNTDLATGPTTDEVDNTGGNATMPIVDSADISNTRADSARKSGTDGTRTSLREYSDVILDIDSQLVWVKNIYAVGYTKALFEKSRTGEGSLAHDIKAIRDKASVLDLGGITEWRLATTQDVATLRKIDPSAVFLAFYNGRPGPLDVIGIYQNENGDVSSWGYQHANHLQGPYENNWIQGNDYGVWLVSDTGEGLEPKDGKPVHARPEQTDEKALTPIIAGRLMKSGEMITSDWDGIANGLIGNLESDDTRTVFEYSLKSLDRGGYVRAELLLDVTQRSGDGEATISIYQGDGLVKDGDWNPDGLKSTNQNETITWSAEQNIRVELPAHILRNFFNTGETVGFHFRYSGKGNIHFKSPILIVTYVEKGNLLTQYIDR